MLRSFFSRSREKKLESYVAYLVNHYNTPKRRKIVLNALAILKEFGYDNSRSSEDQTLIHHCILLKKFVGENERGVLIVSFENELLKLLVSDSFSDIENKYQIIFLPSWHPIYSVPLLYLGAKATKDFFVMPSSFDSMDLCSDIGRFCICLPFHAASWVNDAFYSCAPVRKDIDIIMVAIFGKYKRHWRLFEAMTELPPNLIVYLLGKEYGSRTKGSLLREAWAFGVEDRINVIEDPSQDTIADYMSRSKIFCALTHKEGSYIAVVESLMANTPVGMYSNAMIGSKTYINKQTGLFFDPNKRLGPQLMDFIEGSGTFSPGQWARANISARINSQKLNGMLQEHSKLQGLHWDKDIEAFFCRHFDFWYLGGAEREVALSEAYADFRKEFGLTIKRPDPSDYSC